MSIAGLDPTREIVARKLWRERLGATAAGLLALGPLVLVVFYVASYAVNVPYYDHWRGVPYVDGWLTGTLGFESLFARHDGHIAVLARVLTVISAIFFRWNTLFEIWLGLFFLVGAAALITARTPSDRDCETLAARFLGTIPLMAVLFSLRQWENLLAPWSVGFFGAAFFVLLCAYALQKDTLRWRVLGIGAAIVATASMTNGLLVWVIVPVQLFLQRLGGPDPTKRKAGLLGIISWMVLGALVWGLYVFTGPTPVSGGPASLRLGIERFVVVAGLALSPDKAVAAGGALQSVNVPIDATACGIFGLALGCAFVWSMVELWRSGALAANAFAVSVALFGLGSMAMLAVGRAYLGIGQVLSSRYSTASTFFLAGVLLLLRRATWRQPSSWLIHGLAGLVLASNLIASLSELEVGPYRRNMMRDWAQAVHAFRTATEAQLQNPHFSPESIRVYCAALERHHLSVFATDSAPEDDLVAADPLWIRDSATANPSAKPHPELMDLPHGDHEMKAMMFPAPSKYRLDHLHVDPGDTLTFTFGMPSDRGGGAKIVLEAIHATRRVTVFEKLVTPHPSNKPIEWQTVSVPLVAGREETIDLAIGVESSASDSDGNQVAFGGIRIGH